MTSTDTAAEVVSAHTESRPEYRTVPGFPEILVGSDGTAWARIEARPNKKGYMRVSIGKYQPKRGRMRVFLHEFMLRAFIGIRPEGLLCRHLDDDKSNNRIDNLAYGTYQDNADDRVRNGTGSRGSNRWSAKLDESQIPEIRRLAEAGYPREEIAEMFGASLSSIGNILRGETWKHVR